MQKVIAFDMGEVIFTNDWHYDIPEKNKAYCEYFGVTEEQLEEGWQVAWPQFEIGKITEDEYWKIFLDKAGAKNIDIPEAKRLWRKYFTSKPSMFDLLDKLQGKYKLVIISTVPKEWFEFKREKYHLDDYFAEYFTSWEMAMKKTDPEMFRKIITKLQIKPEELLFIDDNPRITATANSIGIETILCKNAEQVTQELQKRNIL